MSSSAVQESGQQAVTNEEFNALEQRVLRAVELLRSERTARAAAEQKLAETEELMQIQVSELSEAQARIQSYEGEREHMRQRVERMLKQLDEINA